MAATSASTSTSRLFGDQYDDDDNYDVSCGRLEIRRVAIDVCLHKDRSVWGIFKRHKSGLLYLSLSFDPHPEYRLAWAEIDLEFVSGRRLGTGPIVDDFVPKRLRGEPHTTNYMKNLVVEPNVGASGAELSLGRFERQEDGQRYSYWTFTATKKIGPDGLHYTGVQWEWEDKKEHGGAAFDRPIASAIVLFHEARPFNLAVSIQGKLRSRLYWWQRFTRPVATTSDGILITPRDGAEDLEKLIHGLENELLEENRRNAAHGK